MNSISSVEQLIKTLDETELDKCIQVAKKIEIPINEFEDFSSWSDDCYTRNCIERNDKYELILLCWKSGDETPIHDHDGQQCWVYQVDGELIEQRFKADENGKLMQTNELLVKPGEVSYMEDNMGYHLLKNESTSKAMSLHLYMQPIDSCRIFNDDEQCFEEVEMNYHTVEGKEIRIGA